MNATTIFTLLILSSIQLLGYNLIPSEQVTNDGFRLLNPKRVAELEQILIGLQDGDTTASGWPMTTFFYEKLIPFGPPRWEKPIKAKHLCDRYLETYGDTPEYWHLKVNYLLMVTYRATRLQLDGKTKLEDPDTFIKPYLKEASELLGRFAPDEKNSLWYMQKARVLGFNDSDLSGWISNVREIHPEQPDLLLTYIYENELDVEAIELEITKRNLSDDSANILYARIITALLQNTYHNQKIFLDTVNWERHMDGLQQLHQQHPTDYNYDVYRYFACFLENKELARKLFEDGPTRPITYLWTSSEFPFEDWKAWATGLNTFPKLEHDKDLVGVWKTVDSFTVYPKRSKNYEANPVFYVYHHNYELQIIGMYSGGMNHKTRSWKILAPGHVSITKLVNQTSWSQTMFTDCETLIVQHLAAPYGTTYFEYIGTTEDVLPSIIETYFELNPNKTGVQRPGK